MEYDYGAGWEFKIELLSMTEMRRGAGMHYPYVTDGKGKGIIEGHHHIILLKLLRKRMRRAYFRKLQICIQDRK